MTKFDLYNYVLNCVKNLCKRYSEHIEWFEYESHFHSDLYAICCMKNKLFFDDCCVEMGTEKNFSGHDLRVTNPYSHKEEITIELKHFTKEKDVEKDLIRLSSIRGKKIMIYFEKYHYSFKEVESWMINLHKKYPKVSIFYYHPRKKELIVYNNKNIDKYPIK